MSHLAGISECCLSGHLHTGTPRGETINIAGLSAYITGTNLSKTIVVITNIKLLADEYANTGNFRVIVPDIFDGDSVPIHHLSSLIPLPSTAPPTNEAKQAAFSDIGPWLERQKDDVVQPRIKNVIEAVRGEQGVKAVGLLGFCWGGRQVLHLATETSKVDAIVANHPSYAEFPTVFEAIQIPVLIQVGDNDPFFPPEQVNQVNNTIFPTKTNCQVIVYPGAIHGFACRNDQNNAEETKWKDDSARKGIEFFATHLAA